jgi:hypothetical protein
MPDNSKNDIGPESLAVSQNCVRFVRRDDLTPQVRMCVAFTALMAMTFGCGGL